MRGRPLLNGPSLLPFVRGGKGGVELPAHEAQVGAVDDSTSPPPSLQRRGKGEAACPAFPIAATSPLWDKAGEWEKG